MNILKFLKPKSTIVWLKEDDTLRQAIERIKPHSYTAVPVVANDGKYKGTVTEGDLLRYIVKVGDYDLHGFEHVPINEILRDGFNPAIDIQATRDTVIDRISNQNFLPVCDDRGMFVGIITRRDLIRYLAGIED